jgi:DNA-binding SARP family transcriptional activator/predicted ATPase
MANGRANARADGPETGLEFGVLGPVEVRSGGEPVAIGGGRERFVLATLLLDAGRPVSAARLVDALWDEPPRSAKAQLHNIVSRLRRVVGVIRTTATGYELRIPDDALDLLRFRTLVAAGLRARAAGDTAAAADLLGRALAWWRGPALADIPHELAATVRHGLGEERLAAAEARADAQLALGRYADALGELTELLTEHPYREHLYRARMIALLGVGRRADALETYRLARRTLVDGLGIEPGPALRELEQRVLRGEGVPPGPGAGNRVVARQLPPLTAVLTGRDELVAELRDLLTGPPAGGPVLAVLVGPGGVGKTTVALAAAGQAAAVFTGGQLYADLRGGRETPHTVVGRFLHALGVRQSKLPADTGERLAMYQGLLARTRTLVVLDDAADEGQVRELLPSDPGCAALVTSRRRLDVPGAVRWTVPVLTRDAALELLARIVGPARVAAEPDAAADLAAVCGQLPLAVSIVAGRLAVRPDWTLAEFRERLGRERDRLDELAVGDLDVRASIASSYVLLSPGARRLLRLLGLVTAADWPAWVPQALLGPAGNGPPAELAELTGVHLVARLGRDAAGQERFRLHDLVADYAREELHATEPEHERTAAAARLLTGWLALAVAADAQVPHGEMFPLPVAVGPPPVPVTAAYDWFDAERASLLAAVDQAVLLGRADLAGHLALYVSGYLELRCFYDDWLAVLRRAVEPVRAAGEDALLVRLLSALFAAHGLADRFPEQTAVAEEELAAARRLGDETAYVTALGHAGRAARDNGRFRRAAELLGEAVERASRPPVASEALVDVLAGSAVLHIKAGEPDRAVELLTRLRALDDATGESARSVLYRYLSCLALVDLGRLAAAEEVLTETLATCSAIGDDVGIVYLTWVLATVDLRAGRFEPAAARLGQALRGAERLGAHDAVAEALRSLGDLAAAQGRTAAAAEAMRGALEIWRGLGVRLQVARTLARLEHVLRSAGDTAGATACRREWQGTLADLELTESCLRLPPARSATS